MSLKFKEVAEILKIIDASDCEEVVLDLEGFKLSVQRGDKRTSGTKPATRSATPVAETETASSSTVTPAPPKPTVADTANGIRAPMVGTFYRRSSPDKPPFVEVNQHISAGDAVCLIEVMKLYTTIESSLSGTVLSIEADDGDLVDYDQILFVIDPD